MLDVNQVPVETEDRMETFWLSETLSTLIHSSVPGLCIPLEDRLLTLSLRS